MTAHEIAIPLLLCVWALWFAWWVWYQTTGRIDADAKRVADWLTRKALGEDEHE